MRPMALRPTRERPALREFNHERIICYDRNDLAAGAFRERCLQIIETGSSLRIKTINDAIEVHQLKLTLETIPELFEGTDVANAIEVASNLFSSACRYVRERLSSSSIVEVYEDMEVQYADQFWDLLCSCGAEKLICGEKLSVLLSRHVECLPGILANKKIVGMFDAEIRESLIDNPYFSAELLIREYATKSGDPDGIFLPKSLSQDDFDSIMADYLGDQRANPNYEEALFNWPSGSSKCEFSPSPHVKVQAKRAYDAAMETMFGQGAGLEYGAGVRIDPEQVACKGIERDGFTLIYSFSERWLEKYTDHATVMNNCRYLLDIVDNDGFMSMPAHAHEESGLLATLGSRVLGEYRTNMASNMRESLSYTEVVAYSHFLESRGAKLERAIEWAYNVYFAEEYSIDGFTLALPADGASWLDKCKSIGPEIERAAKSYSIYSTAGRIDGDYFPYVTFKSFGDLKALSERKYAIAGSDFDQYATSLFSDQCMLTYRRGHDDKARCFYELMRKTEVFVGDYNPIYADLIHRLIDSKLVCMDDETEALSPTPRADCLKAAWDNGAVSLQGRGSDGLAIVESLVSDGMLSYSEKLFTPDESAYLDYMFNDATFSNSQGLRNRYDHAHSPIVDPNSEEFRADYYRMLTLLIAVTLKINDELSATTGRGRLENFVDWPYYDESVLNLVEELAAGEK